MKFKITRSAPRIPSLIEHEQWAEEIEDAAQIFKTDAEPPEQWKLAEIVEELAVNDCVEYTRPDGKTVVCKLVSVGAVV